MTVTDLQGSGARRLPINVVLACWVRLPAYAARSAAVLRVCRLAPLAQVQPLLRVAAQAPRQLAARIRLVANLPEGVIFALSRRRSALSFGCQRRHQRFRLPNNL